MTTHVPFFLGVAGKMSFPGYDDAVSDPEQLSVVATELRARVFAILDWLRSRPCPAPACGALDPLSGGFDPQRTCGRYGATDAPAPCWSPLGLERTPIVVLSMLAPGIDTLVAEAALDYATERHANVTVRAPLPFPIANDAAASSFVRVDDPKGNAARQERLARLVARLRAQPGFLEERDVFCVRLAEELEVADPAADPSAVDDEKRRRRRLRYRAAGESIALTSHLLLAAYDETAEPPAALDSSNLFVASTLTAVEAKRRGATFGLLATTTNLTGADNGPVLHLPLDLKSDGTHPVGRPLRLLHPYDVQPGPPEHLTFADRMRGLLLLSPLKRKESTMHVASVQDDDPEWQRVGDELFRRVASRLEAFNALVVNESEKKELRSLCTPKESEQEAVERCGSGDAAVRKLGESVSATDFLFMRHFAPLAAVRRRAANSAEKKEGLRTTLMRRLVWLIFFAASALGVYEHWTTNDAPAQGGAAARAADAVNDEHAALFASGAGLAATGILVFALGCVVASGILYWRYRRSDAESDRFDHRAIAEGLRVQFYWSACGLRAAAGAEYLQRHRGELSWIRQALTALAYPTDRPATAFRNAGREVQARLLEMTRLMWVRKQRRYVHDTAAKNEAAAHRWHARGWLLAAAGLLNVVGKLLVEASPALHGAMEHHAFAIGRAVLGSGVIVLAYVFLRSLLTGGGHAGAAHDEPSAARPFAYWIVARPLLWGWALVLGAAAFLAANVLAPLTAPWLTTHALWIITTGTLLLGGALCLAWTERNFHGEHARQKRALEALYASADRRLERLIRSYAAETDDGSAARTLAEIQRVLYELGCEALAENAEWLILHRTRPLEPFMAG